MGGLNLSWHGDHVPFAVFLQSRVGDLLSIHRARPKLQAAILLVGSAMATAQPASPPLPIATPSTAVSGMGSPASPVAPKQADNPISFKSKAPPTYPHNVLCRGIGGTVSMLVSVDPQGKLVEVHVDRSSGNQRLDRAALDAAHTWTFNASMRNGVATAALASVPVSFEASPIPTDCPKIESDVSPNFDPAVLKPPNPADAVEFANVQLAASKQDLHAQTRLGEIYEDGQGVAADPTRALMWLRKAANQGDARAQYDLGAMYEVGDGVPLDRADALDWYRKAAAQGNADAQFKLGDRYWVGDGVRLDATRAVAWFQQAAAQGNAGAESKLGMAYARGDGVPKDPVQALLWYQKAAAEGDFIAQTSLGWMYYSGSGVPADPTTAAGWYLKAAEQGGFLAASRLADMYARGDGVPRDSVLAYAWLSLAAERETSPTLTRELASLRNSLTVAEYLEANRLTYTWAKGRGLARGPARP